jgi:BirA family biotin operon repressor/biotin-[acetyl-CoA-carboxylase] ligase
MTVRAPILILDEVDSTNAEARRRAEAGETGPLWIAARRQSAGRGRRGRVWETGEGNLAATRLEISDRPPAEAAQISFVAALAVSDLAGRYVAADRVKLKWPNDVLIDAEKAAGVLVESGPLAAGGLWLATGIGVNLAWAPVLPDRATTSLAACGVTPPTPADALDVLAVAFEHWSDVWRVAGFAAIGRAWTERAYGLGGPCVARPGTEVVEGVAEGLDIDGALRLRLQSGAVRRISAGDVFFEGL